MQPIERLNLIAMHNKAVVRNSFDGETAVFTVGYFQGNKAFRYQSKSFNRCVKNIIRQLDANNLNPYFNEDSTKESIKTRYYEK